MRLSDMFVKHPDFNVRTQVRFTQDKRRRFDVNVSVVGFQCELCECEWLPNEQKPCHCPLLKNDDNPVVDHSTGRASIGLVRAELERHPPYCRCVLSSDEGGAT